jgi:hypothetical protein
MSRKMCVYQRRLNECLPEAFAMASEFFREYSQIELLRIRSQLEQMVAGSTSGFARSRKFVVAYLAACICIEIPTLLSHSLPPSNQRADALFN